MTLKVLQGDRPNLRVAVTEKGTAEHASFENIEIGEAIKFKINDLDAYRNRNWDARVYDFLVLAAACEFCDRTLKRSKWGWVRRFDLKLPVHDLTVWESPEVHSSLLSALGFLTGDEWHVSFYKRREAADEVNPQSRLELLDGSKTIIPFSNGMDSRAVGAMLETDQRELIRLRVGSNASDCPKVGKRKAPFMTVPYKVKPSALRFNESSARSRGFKFALLSGIAAYLVGTGDVALPESGQGALGPSLVPTSHGYEDYRSHPLFLGRMQRLIAAVFNHSVTYRLPRLWNTKGQTLRDFAAMPAHKGEWSKTWSCWRQNRQVSVDHKRRHCVVCAACMLRRLSVHAAGLEESLDTYVWEDLSASTFEAGAAIGFNKKTQAMRQYAIAGALHLDHLAELYSSPLHQQRLDRYSWFLSEELGMTHQDTKERLNDLLKQHDIEWNAFLKDLDSNSFVSNWLAA